ncbi:hypothetical protein BASA50_002157 [Batrachochytrium salamandrivorans]|uniref:Coatomer subunit delta n=1 Tax=Batrachochytrium salamandrivorans TaxID=1357716 RepID=A0ABQ8FPV8_9FUNG|nr:hypothetical protein BASA62_007924 [Batrachochytrium salamandrivorans]KAH6571653.1 hypothetical protein BASA60_007050 [Batrachochytrium salamandrivorans]KAH6593452.1 hypothetical protein BASA61_004289 [Batrachochytrium salamandrivorans]KAH6600593.1 hypothetical protein BASA50_002157 [Batrachochytrium salamandrivorans]KAH9272203.1 hypothetical protein BASA83_005544 [Batrachochytrium salamandrivorans]
MVVLAASICTKAGKAVLSRQFVEISRSRIEGLIASFPKLIGTSDQHTYIETDAVRYVYQPLENLYMVLVTTKNSNILQDIDTLHLFARLVSEYCRSNDEREIAKHAFDLLLVFDEVISLGYRENINLGQIRTISVMESHEERVQAEIEKNKEKEAKEELKRKAKMIDTQRREAGKKGYAAPGGGFGGFGMGKSGASSGTGGGMSSMSGFSSSGYSNAPSNQGGFSSSSSGGYGQTASSAGSLNQNSAGAASTPSTSSSGRGMQLGGGQRYNSVLDSITAYEGIKGSSKSNVSAGAPTQGTTHAAVSEEGVHVAVEEKVSVAINRDGGLQSLEINGSMMLKINNPSTARVRLAITHGADPNLRFTTHPNVDKALWASESVVALRDPSRPFPIGQALGILRWKLSSRDESIAPLLINCWPSPTGNGTCDVNIEYELQNLGIELRDVLISIPYPGGHVPTVGDVEGHYEIDRQKLLVQWSLPLIDASNASGVLEFSVSGEDVGGFFPIQISFTSSKLLNSVQITNVDAVDGGAAAFSVDTVLRSDLYQVM